MTAALEPGQGGRIRNGGPKDGYLVTVLEVHDAHGTVRVTWHDTFRDEQRTAVLFADELVPVDLGTSLTSHQVAAHTAATGATFAEVIRAWIDPDLIPAVLAAADGALARDEHGGVQVVSLALPGPHGAILATADDVREWLRQADGDPATAAEALTRAILTNPEGAPTMTTTSATIRGTDYPAGREVAAVSIVDPDGDGPLISARVDEHLTLDAARDLAETILTFVRVSEPRPTADTLETVEPAVIDLGNGATFTPGRSQRNLIANLTAVLERDDVDLETVARLSAALDVDPWTLLADPA